MRVTGWHVEGLGLLHEHVVTDLPPGLTVVLGPNEAGKSTLLDFLRFTLFGYPRSVAERRAPLRGGRHGGKVFLESPEGSHVLERHAGNRDSYSLRLPDGRAGSAEDFQRLTGNSDARLFQSIFAFGLGELSSLSTLQDDQVRDRLYAGGLQGAGPSLATVRRKLAEEQGELLRPRAGRARINDLTRELDALHLALREARARAMRHPELVRREAELEAAIDEARQALEALSAARSRQEKRRSAWEPWLALLGVQEELAALEVLPPVPATAHQELKLLAQSLGDLGRVLEEEEGAQAELVRRVETLLVDEAILAAGDRLTELLEERKAYETARTSRATCRDRRRERERALRDALADLGPDWDAERLAHFDLSLPRGEEAQAHGTAMEEATRHLEAAGQRLVDRRAALEGLRVELARQEELLRLRGEVPAAAAIAARRKHLLDLRTLVLRRDDLSREITTLQADLRRREQAQPMAEPGVAPLEERRRQLANLRATLSRLEDARRAGEDTAEELARREQALTSLGAFAAPGSLEAARRNLAAARSLESRREDARRAIEASRDELRRAEAARGVGVKSARADVLAPMRLALRVLAGALLVGGVAAFALRQHSVAIALVGVAAACLALSFIPAAQATSPAGASSFDWLESRSAELSRRESEAVQLEGQWRALIAELGLTPQAESAQLDALATRLEEAGRLLGEQNWLRTELKQHETQALRRKSELATAAVALALPAVPTPLEVEALSARLEAAAGTQADLAWMANLRERIKQVAADAERLEREIAERAIMAALEGDATAAMLEAAQARLEADAVLLGEFENARRELEGTRQRLEAARAAQEGAQQEVAARDEAFNLAQEGFSRWKRDVGLPESLSPKGIWEFQERVRGARALAREIQTLEEDLAAHEHTVTQFEALVAELLQGIAHAPVQPGTPLLAALENLRMRLEAQRQLASRKEELEAQRSERQASLEVRRQQGEALAVRRSALLEAAGCPDEEELVRRFEIQEHRRQLEQALKERRRELERHLGRGESAEALEVELASGDLDAWETEERLANQRREEADLQLESLLREHESQRNVREALERDNDLAGMMAQEQTLLAQRSRAVRRWQVLSVAMELLEDTQQRFEKDRQPHVLAHAGGFFGRATQGRYDHLLQRDEGFVVVDRRQNELAPEVLSRGTAEQLYLCLRLGLARELSRQGTALPFVMDDILVNFDPERAQAVAGLLAEFAKHDQVLFFTCHPETVERLRHAEPGVTVLAMERVEWAQERPVPVATVPVSGEESARDRLVAALVQADGALGKNELLRRSGILETQWQALIQTLKVEGLIEQDGEKRGAVYRLAR